MKHEELTRRIIKVFYEVYNELGYGFIESVYENAMRIALRQEGLFVPEKAGIEVLFRGIVVGTFAPDAVVEGLVIIELKVGRALDSSHEAQLLNYLRASSMEVGLLLLFGPKPELRRMVMDNDRKRTPRELGQPFSAE